MFETARQRVADWYAERNEREQLWLKVAGIVLPLVALVFVAILFNQSLNSVRNDIQTYERTLQLLGDIAPKYRKNQNSGKEDGSQKFSPKAIKDNDIKLTSFVATHATAVGIQVDSYDESERRLGGGDKEGESEGSALNKLQVDVEIREVTTDKLMKLLERIEQANKPVVIERITLSRKQRDTGKVSATLVVTTYKRKAEG